MTMRGKLLCAGLVVIAIGVVVKVARAQDDCQVGQFGCGHHANHEAYREWISPAGMSCCNGQDCRPIRAKPEGEGKWSIWIPEYHAWVPVPATAKLKPDLLQDGRSHACTANPRVWQEYGRPAVELPVYCFSPAEVKG